MQTHADFVFHLEEPREQFSDGTKRLRGWIAAQEPVSEVHLCGRDERLLQLEERPDVRRAFPNFASAIGFSDDVHATDLCERKLQFRFGLSSVVEELPAAPTPPQWPKRAFLKLRRALQLQRLRIATNAHARWNAALHAFLLEVEITRGGDFRREEADRVIALFAENSPEAFVVQIGANDGVSGDPLVAAFARTRWSGLLVEPVPYLHATLAARYAERPEVRVVQAAISSRDGDAPLYRLRDIPGKTPEWFSHLATLDREILLRHRASIPDLESLIVEERVPTLRLETLLQQHAVAHIEFLVIDTEGHDFEILCQVDFNRYQPALILFEHQHLTASDKAAAYALVSANGYECKEMPEGDAIAWRML